MTIPGPPHDPSDPRPPVSPLPTPPPIPGGATPPPVPPPGPSTTPPIPTSPPPGGDPWGAPPPGGSVAPTPAKKSNTKRILLIILGVLVLLIGGCSFVVYQLANQLTGPVDVSNEWLAALDERDYQRASELSDPSCFSESDAAFYDDLFATFDIVSYNLSSSSIVNGRADTSGTVTFAGEEARSVAIGLTDVDGWKICRFDVGLPGSAS